MTFDGLSSYHTGILVPVSALRSDENLGAGEFADLPALAAWCADAGMDLIQLLPVNDTGDQSSPYSALSAFALHPMYLRIADLPDLDALSELDRATILKQTSDLRREHAGSDRIRYRDLLAGKLSLISRLFSRLDLDGSSRAALDQFSADNPWIRDYAAFKVLKSQNDSRPWREWPEYRDPTSADVDRIWASEELEEGLLLQVWLQMRLEEQFRTAVQSVVDVGVILKGDLPILMNEDSVDVWAKRELFITHLRAGAPPDMFTHLGQNWGLPIYDWDRMAETEYRWWKDRLVQAGKFYASYRIDHVLGFFRVWAIAATNSSGILGHFFPSEPATVSRLQEAGFDEGRIRWLAEPHLAGPDVREALGPEAPDAFSLALAQIGDEDLYVFRGSIEGERDLASLPMTSAAREWIVGRYADRALLHLGNGSYAPTWDFRRCTRYQQLRDQEKESFERLVRELGEASELIWEQQARRLLGFMNEATDMLACAEDLGVIPNAVPKVLGDLGMLGLRIPRWARLWDQPGQPYIRPNEFPFLTVCAPSVHDTSTMRGWWQEDQDRQAFWSCLGLEGPAPDEYDTETARQVTIAILRTSSAICVLQMQDVLALAAGLPTASHEAERVNVPGTVNDFNWNYRMPVTIAELAARSDLLAILGPMVKERKTRSVPPAEGRAG